MDLEIRPTQQSHTLAGRSGQLTNQSQPKSVPAQPEKRNFQKCPRTTEKKDKDNDRGTRMDFLIG